MRIDNTPLDLKVAQKSWYHFGNIQCFVNLL